jgi:hypothetical protein
MATTYITKQTGGVRIMEGTKVFGDYTSKPTSIKVKGSNAILQFADIEEVPISKDNLEIDTGTGSVVFTGTAAELSLKLMNEVFFLASGSAVTIDTDSTFAANSDVVVPSQKAVKTALALKEALANKDATGGYAGLTLYKINFKNAANTFTSFFTNANTAARTYTFQDRNGTIADNTDLALKANLAGGNTFTGQQTLNNNTVQIFKATSGSPLIGLSLQTSGDVERGFVTIDLNGGEMKVGCGTGGYNTNIYSNGSKVIDTTTGLNIGFFGTGSYGSGVKVVSILNATTIPSANPTGGGILYSEGGALKWRGSAGTVTQIAAA